MFQNLSQCGIVLSGLSRRTLKAPATILAIAILVLLGCKDSKTLRSSSSTAIASSPDVSRDDATIWSDLRQGRGYVLILRHALAPGTGDPVNFRLEDCSTQRNLSAAGRQQAARLGQILKAQQIPVAQVLSSQWCRCLETARILDLGSVLPFPTVNSFFQDSSTASNQTTELRQFIQQNQDKKGVTVIVTHQVNITAISNVVPASGSGVVMRASPQNEVELVTELHPLDMP